MATETLKKHLYLTTDYCGWCLILNILKSTCIIESRPHIGRIEQQSRKMPIFLGGFGRLHHGDTRWENGQHSGNHRQNVATVVDVALLRTLLN